MKKYICIHGHFYQPPRENAWLETIEVQESAFPFHDWNERINFECYGPNAQARVLDSDGKIINIVNNYSKISFNFGPTLLSWMEEYEPSTYKGILEADLESMSRFKGHGSAMAQVYNHIIMPLANTRDKETQIIWGIKDFEHRFKRQPEGMWLAETAVDLESLDLMAKHGIKYTLLAPRQAKRFRKIGDKEWTDGINSRKSYIINLPSGRQMNLFFYDGDRSQEIAFKGLLSDGEKFAHHLTSSFDETDKDSQLVHVATDGESYGHHHRYGEMALAYCLKKIESLKEFELINYGQYLEINPPVHEVEIHEDSSWSCVHGIERWRSDCGCSTGGRPEWNQKWRVGLRDSLNWLRDELAASYEKEMKKFETDPWELRQKYIEVLLNRSRPSVDRFINKYVKKIPENQTEKTHLLRLLELQRQSLLMFTSCGWFFDELSGIETVQILQYADRAIQLAESEANINLEKEFANKLEAALSNIEQFGDGKKIYNELVRTGRLTLTSIGLHYAVNSLFADNPAMLSVLNYDCESEIYKRYEAGMQRLALGKTKVVSKVTQSEKVFWFVIVYLGQHQLLGTSSNKFDDESFARVSKEIRDEFNIGNISKTIDIIRANFKSKSFSFYDMFRDEQNKLLDTVLQESISQAESSYRRIYDRNYNLLNVMKNHGLHIPLALKRNIEGVVQTELKKIFQNAKLDMVKLEGTVKEAKKWNVTVNNVILNPLVNNRLIQMLNDYIEQPDDEGTIKNIRKSIRLMRSIGLESNFKQLQNLTFNMLRGYDPFIHNNMDLIESLAEELNLNPDAIRENVKIRK
ncbi:DUF3536 domain-containing protein [Marinigracilibium pacificum]|uniref:DUF3536 domain-containing protein n=1 Tax=Marinigracilibium pacificum TaxID=2729599 RepID=A0A848IXX0_9BACT|nr:DUF3536 domain-containing protein [Marinigracilibium pacificum]NMM48171.1 DUF3536 domain-containing protein [Marinigracilibium pacificum]